jgi:thiopeptide-type bacteriocin biosynthesis protein
VLARATWNLDEATCAAIAGQRGATLWRRIHETRERLRWPDWICLQHGDNELPVNLNNTLCLDAFSHHLKAYSRATVVEMFPAPGDLPARGQDGRFVHELIVPFTRKAAAVSAGGAQTEQAPLTEGASARPASPRTLAVKRGYPPGSEWVYVKFYTGPQTVDDLLGSDVPALLQQLTRARAVDHWHFVRYGDPEWHVRLRLHVARRSLRHLAVASCEKLGSILLKRARVWRVQFETYDREIEAYGGSDASMRLAERVFHRDSEAALGMVKRLRQNEEANDRWRLSLLSTHMLLVDFGLDLAARHRVVSSMRDGLRDEFRGGAILDRQLSAKFRAARRDIDHLMDPNGRGGREPDRNASGRSTSLGTRLLRRRSGLLEPVVGAIRRLELRGKLDACCETLAQRFVHMSNNRLLRSDARLHELVIYDQLKRLYLSDAARAAPQ